MAWLWVISGILAVYIIFIFLPALVAYRFIFARRDGSRFRDYHLDNVYFLPHEKRVKDSLKYLKNVGCRRAVITARDGVSLSAEYYDCGAARTAILMHGYSSLPMSNFCVIAAELVRYGFNCLLPYERAHGESGGDKCSLGIKESEDLLLWIKGCSSPEIMLYGISMGGAALAYAADKLSGTAVKLAIIDCAFESAYAQIKIECRKRHLPGFLLAPLIRLFARCGLGTDIKASVRDSLSRTSLPVLFLHGDMDSAVPLSTGLANYESCTGEKLMLVAKDAEHTMSFLMLDDKQLMQLTEFIGKYI